MAGAALLIAAEFLTLYSLHVITSGSAVSSTLTGRHDSYALIPIALAAVALSLVAGGGWAPGGLAGDGQRWSAMGDRRREGQSARRRGVAGPAIAAAGLLALGLLALLLALLVDLPAVHAHGLTRGFVLAATTAGPGLPIELLGAALLLFSGGAALFAWRFPERAERVRPAAVASRLMAAPAPWTSDARGGEGVRSRTSDRAASDRFNGRLRS